MTINGTNAALASLHAAHLQAARAGESVATNPDALPDALLQLNQAQLQSQIASHVIRTSDEMTRSLIDMIA